MAIVVEDGTGLSTAETFVSVADADAYHLARANSAWALLTTPNKEAALRKAADYMEAVYRERWAGYRVNTTQALSWPRYEVPIKDAASAMNYGGLSYYPYDAVPVIVANACASLALRASAADLAPDVTRVTTRERVGEIEVEYAAGAAPYARYREIDLALSAFMAGSANSIRVARA